YGIDFMRFISGLEPRLVSALMHRDSPDGVDVFMHAEFIVGDLCATVTAAFNTDANYYTICGERGLLYARAAPAGRFVENSMHIHLIDGDKNIEERFAPENAYLAELEYFAQCVERGTQPHPDGENSLKNLQIVEDVFRRAREF
ncbi:MAG: hypothetical protein AAB393_11925, partial [Bacteroidota bacterium]